MGGTRPKIGLTAGAWDFVHAGHCLHFELCKKHCEYLIVALQRDPSLYRSEKNMPIMSLQERYLMLRANRFVDAVMIYDAESELYAIDAWLPDIRFMGIDHKGKKHHKICCPVMYLSGDRNYSSTKIRNALQS